MRRKRGVLLAAPLHMGTALALMLTSMFVGGTIVAALLLRLEYVLLIPAAILTVITLLITPPLLLKLHRAFRPAPLQRPPLTDLRGLSFMKRRMPETPLPVAPLVRVLETYDLSQGNFDYFDTARTEESDNAVLSLGCNTEHIEAQ
jgi:hypothetical protein